MAGPYTPVIEKIQLPNGGAAYYLKDKYAHERIEDLAQQIAGGISFTIAWTATNYAQTTTPSAATLATIPKDVVVYYNSGASSATGTLVASADTQAKFYLIYSNTQAGNVDIYDEYVTVKSGSSYFWEKIGDTSIDLSDVVTDVSLSKSTDVVLGEATTFTNASSSVSFTGGTTDKVLGESTTFALTSGAVTHGALTGHTDTVLGASSTFTVTNPTITVTPTTTYLKGSASGAAVGANGTAAAITGFGTHSTENFVKSVTAETSNKLVTTSITPVNGTQNVSKVTKTASKLVTTSIPNVTSNTSVTIPNVTNKGSASTWSFTVDSSACLVIDGANSVAPTLGTALTATNTVLGTAITAATGSVASTGTGSDIVTAVTVTNYDVAKAGTALSVATGAVSTTGSGSAVVTGVSIGESAAAITALGTPTTATVLTGVKVTSQPTITLATDASSATGRVQVATGISSATATGGAVSASGDNVTAIISMPTSTVGTGITVGTNDKVTAVTGIGTGTAAAQTITVGTNDKVTVLKSTTDVSVTKGKNS